jgi:hypothetical protein
VAAPSGSTPPAKCPYRVFGNLGLSSFPSSLFFSEASFSDYISFLPSSSPSGVATATGMTASVVGTATAVTTIRATPGPAPDGKPQTPEGVPEDVKEEFEEEPEVAPEPVPEVVREEAPAEGAMITIRTAVAPLPSCGARALFSSVPHMVVALRAATGAGMEVVLGHPTPYSLDGISLSEVMSMAHQALSQVQRVLHHDGEDLADKRRRLQLWANMLKRMTVSERAVAWAQQHGFGLQVEVITQRDADSQRALADAQELYASIEAWASAIIKQEEDLAVHACQVNQRVLEVEEIEGLLQEQEGQLQEREELDDITLCHELEVLSTRETSLDRREADLEREHKAL